LPVRFYPSGQARAIADLRYPADQTCPENPAGLPENGARLEFISLILLVYLELRPGTELARRGLAKHIQSRMRSWQCVVSLEKDF
jgi:hypothetical protein